LTSFGVSGLILQNIFHGISGIYLHGLIASILAFFTGFLFTKMFTYLISFVIPKEHTQGIQFKHMIGKIATVTVPVRIINGTGMIRFSDQYNVTHTAIAVALNNNEEFSNGDKVLLAEYDKGTRIFKVAKLPLTLS